MHNTRAHTECQHDGVDSSLGGVGRAVPARRCTYSYDVAGIHQVTYILAGRVASYLPYMVTFGGTLSPWHNLIGQCQMCLSARYHNNPP